MFALALVAAQPPPYYVVIYNGLDGVGTSTCTGTVNTTLTNIFPNQCFPLPTWISPSVPLYIKIAVISNGPPFNVSTTTWADAGCSATMVSSTASIIAKTCRPFAGFSNAFQLNAATLAAAFLSTRPSDPYESLLYCSRWGRISRVTLGSSSLAPRPRTDCPTNDFSRP